MEPRRTLTRQDWAVHRVGVRTAVSDMSGMPLSMRRWSRHTSVFIRSGDGVPAHRVPRVRRTLNLVSFMSARWGSDRLVDVDLARTTTYEHSSARISAIAGPMSLKEIAWTGAQSVVGASMRVYRASPLYPQLGR